MNNRNIIVERIKDDWGTMAHFCRKNNIKFNTLKGFIYGFQRSPSIQAILTEMGYLQDLSEIPSGKNVYDQRKEEVA